MFKTQEDPIKPEFDVVTSDSLQSLTRAEIDIQIATAHRFPRSLSKFKQKALEMATLDQETAESCFYCLPRGGKQIQGPSARLAEIVASAWGNIRAGARVIANDGKTITSQAICHDLETNTAITIEVKRRITDKAGKTFTEDMQVVAGNAACSIALRNGLFKTIPFAYVRSIYEEAKRTAIGDATTLVQRRTHALQHFAKMGIAEARVLSVLGKAKLEDVGLEDLETLTGIKTAIKEGDVTLDEAFPEVAPVNKPKISKETPKAPEPAKQEASPAAPVEALSPTPPISHVLSDTGGEKTQKMLALCKEHDLEVSLAREYLQAMGHESFEEMADGYFQSVISKPARFVSLIKSSMKAGAK